MQNKREAGGDAKHVYFFTWPNEYIFVRPYVHVQSHTK